jgi:hypothetical protein
VSISQRLKKYEDILERPLEEQVNLALGNVVGLAGSIKAGDFPVEPVKGACGHCRMKELCRIDQWGQVEKPEQESIA